MRFALRSSSGPHALIGSDAPKVSRCSKCYEYDQRVLTMQT